MKHYILIPLFLCVLATGFIHFYFPGPRVEPTRPPLPAYSLRDGMIVELTGTTDLYLNYGPFSDNAELVMAGSTVRHHSLFEPGRLDPGDEVRILGIAHQGYRVVVESGRLRGRSGWIIRKELR